MIRSRRLALAAFGVALALSACGDPNVTTPLAEQPPVIELANGQTGAAGAALEAASADAPAAATADSKIGFMAYTDFVYDGTIPALDSPAGSWFFAAGQQPDLDRVAALAASLGVEGEVRTLSPDQGGGWAVGPEDYSAAVLSVGSDGMLSWYLSAATTAIDAGCAVSMSGSGSSGAAVDVQPPTTDLQISLPDPGSTIAATDVPAATMPVDVVAPDECAMPEPPVGVPTKDEALATAKQLFADWGYDVDAYQFDDAYADEWGASVNASLVLDGMKAPVMLSVGFGENGAVTYASGYLAVAERGADYPTIGAAAGLERLQGQQSQFLGDEQPAVMESSGDVATDGAATDVAIAPCEPEAARSDCAPYNNEPITVTLNSVTTDLTMVWAADDTIWLLPAYTFGSTDGGTYSVIAVDDSYIHEADPVADSSTQKPAIDPGAVPGTGLGVPVPAVAPDAPSPETTSAP